jgi:putative ABC transport system permease protein
MLSNYLKITSRNLWRNKTFASINIAGLAIGMATCILILLFVQHELSFDRFHEKADRIYRVTFSGNVQGQVMHEASVMPPVAQALKADYHEIETSTRLREMGKPTIKYQNNTFKGDKAAYIDANFFEVFTLPLLHGDPTSVLQQPNTVVLTKHIAKKYFGNSDPIGQILSIENITAPCTVTGIINDIPSNSHFRMEIFVAMAGLPEAQLPTWMSSNFFTYIVLKEGQNYQQLAAKLPLTIDKYLAPQMPEAMGMTLQEFRNQGNSLGLSLQPLTDIHFGAGFEYEMEPTGNIQYVYMFSAIALFVLLIACINFMNLATAAAAKRAKEVGIRKVMGSTKTALIKQFIAESMLLTGISLLLAVGLVYVVMPFFKAFVDLPLSLHPLDNNWLLPGIVVVGLITGILSGVYPAFFLSAFEPISVLKGKLVQGKNKFGLRSGLVVFQFSISILLTISTLFVYQQLSFIQNKQLGYQKEQVVVLPNIGQLGNNWPVFKRQLEQNPRVQSVSNSGYLPAGDSFGNNFFIAPEEHDKQLTKTLRYDIDEKYLATLGMSLASGRNFSSDYGSDSTSMIVNETAAKALGWEKDAVGHIVHYTQKNGQTIHYQVIGVVKDFHFRSLHEAISPLVMVWNKSNNGNLIVKANASDMSELLANAKANWESFSPSEPFTYTFLEERFEQTYKSEQKTGLMLAIFAGLTIFVACLGLFGLAMFTTVQRAKEIGVRKVLGASVVSVVALLSTDFLKLVLLGLVIAVPVAYYCMNLWLSDFAYHVDMQWWIFVAAGLVAILVAFLTVAGQAMKAAVKNPVSALKSE